MREVLVAVLAVMSLCGVAFLVGLHMDHWTVWVVVGFCVVQTMLAIGWRSAAIKSQAETLYWRNLAMRPWAE